MSISLSLPEKIEVEQRHISEGCQSSSYGCPIALAFLEELDWKKSDLDKIVAISEESITFYENSLTDNLTTRIESIDIDPEVKSWIRNYDDFSKDPLKSKPITLILKENPLQEQFYTLGK